MIGKQSNKVKNTIERGIVKRFVEAIGDPHPIYIDEEVGLKSIYGKNIVPPTFPRVLDYGEIKGLKLPENGLIHGEQRYYYERPLFVDEEINCFSEVKSYVEKKGSNGRIGILEIINYGEDQEGKLIFTEEMLTIITEAVREAMLHE